MHPNLEPDAIHARLSRPVSVAEMVAIDDTPRTRSLATLAFDVIEHHTTDLLHDLRKILSTPNVPHIVSADKHGSYIATLYPANHPEWPAPGERVPYLFGTATREHILDQTSAYIRPGAELFLYVPDRAYSTCGIITKASARERIAEYIATVHRQWTRSKLRVTA
jgi:hypothetical protein